MLFRSRGAEKVARIPVKIIPTTELPKKPDWIRVRYFKHHDVLPIFDVLDTYTNHATDDPFGSVEDGCSIYVRGRLFETAWETRPAKDDTENVSILTDVVGTQQLDREEGRGILFSPDFEFEQPGPRRRQVLPWLWLSL